MSGVAQGTRSNTQQVEMQHIIDNIFPDEEHILEYLQSAKIKSLGKFSTARIGNIKAAKYNDGSTVTTIPEETVDRIMAFRKFLRFKGHLPDPDQRIDSDYTKINKEDFQWFLDAYYDVDTDGFTPQYQAFQDAAIQTYTNKLLRTTTTNAVPTAPTKRSAVDEFKRGIKRDATVYPKLTELERYFGWHRRFTKVAKAQLVENVLDPDYDPTAGSEEEELFQIQKNFLDSVLPDVFLCAEARQILDDQRDNSDPQKALAALKKIAINSTAAILRMSTILYDLKMCDWNTTKAKNGARGYVVHVHELLELHNDIAHTEEAQLSDFTKKQRMREAMVNNEKLSQVAEYEAHIVAEDSSKAYSYTKYYLLLIDAADRYDAAAQSNHSSKGHQSQRKVYLTESDFDNISVQDFVALKAARMNADGKVRMDFTSWRDLSVEDKETWDKLSEAGKGTILRFVASEDSKPTPAPRRQNQRPRPPRRVNMTDTDFGSVTLDELFACMHSVETDSGATETDTSDEQTVVRQAHSASTSFTEPVDFKAYLTKKLDTSNLPQSDVRRMMSTSHTPTTARSKDEMPDITIINGKKYRLCNVTKRHFSVSVRARSRGKHGSMLDRGANCFMAGDNVTIIAIIPNVRADVTGLNNHQVTDLGIGSIGYYAESNRGPVICIAHQAALHGVGTSIASSGQMEAFGLIIDDKSMQVGGGQKIITPDGYIFPVDIINGLPYTPMRPFTEAEWNELPHVVLTSEEWDPRSLDCLISDKEDWYDAISNSGADPRTSLFDMDGNYKLRTNRCVRSDSYVMCGDTFFDAIDGVESASLHHMHDIADRCAAVHTYHTQFLDAFSYFPDDDDDDENTDVFQYDAFPVATRSQTRTAELVDNVAVPTPSTDLTERITAPAPRALTIQPKDYSVLRPFLAWLPLDTVKRTFEVTTQHARLPASTLLKKRFKSPFPAFNIRRRNENVATDFVYSDTPAVGTGDTIAAIFVGRTTKVTDAYGIKTETHFPATLEDNVRQRGAMDKLVSDRARSTYSRRALDFLRYFGISQWQSEPYHQNQNFAEDRIDDIKRDTNVLMDRTGTPADLWLLCLIFVCFLLNNVAHPSLQWNTPLFTLTGQRNDISMLLCFVWYQPVYYKVYEKSFPSDSTEARGRFVGISEHVGHRMTFKILTDDTREIIYRSEVRSALDHLDTNLRVDTIFDGEVSKEFVKRLNEAAQKTILEELNQNGECVADSVGNTTPQDGEQVSHDGEQASPTDVVHTNSSDVKDSSMSQFVPSDLLGRTFLMDKGKDGQRHRAKIKEIVEAVEAVECYERELLKDPAHVKFRVSVNNDKYEEILSFSEVLDYIERKENDDSDPDWKYRKIVAHQGPLRQTDPNYLGSQWNVMLELENGEVVEQPLSLTAAEEPVICTLYASENGLLDTPGWQRFKKQASRQKKMLRQVKQAKLRSYRSAPKYMYGYEVPRDYEHAVKLDQQNGNTKWQDATALEMESLHEYDTFKDFGRADKPGIKPPDGYKKIRVHLVFAVKHDGRHKARLVADGHLTDIPIESVYSGVVSLRGLRLVLFLAELNGLESWTTDVGNAYLEADTQEKVYIIAGPEFGKLEGHILVIHKALYGLRSSGKRWGERLADCLRSMGFEPCKAEPDIWLRRKDDVYEYIATYVDDLELASKDPKSIIFELEVTHGFKLKGTGPIEFHLGCDFGRDEDGTLFMEPKKYIEKMIETYERLFGSRMPSNCLSPLEKGDHPELDTSDFLDEDDTQIYQSLIGSMQWALSLTRFDIATAVMTLSSFRVAPRVGHLERAKRVYCYLAKFPHARLRFRTQEPDYSAIPDNQFDWMRTVYGSPEEELPNDIPTPLGGRVVITHYVDANLYHDKLTGRSVTGILDFVNKTPIDWYSKKQATVETATYGSEFVASRTCVERSIDLRTLLRYLGVPISKTAYMFGDNEAVVNSSSTPHAKLHKRHSALSFHRVREAIAAKIIRYHHVKSEANPADILSKHWGHNLAWPLLQCLLFWHGDTIDLEKKEVERIKIGERSSVTYRQHGE